MQLVKDPKTNKTFALKVNNSLHAAALFDELSSFVRACLVVHRLSTSNRLFRPVSRVTL